MKAPATFRNLYRVAVVVFLFLNGTGFASAQQTIIWAHDAQPPGFVETPNGLEGFAGYTLRWFQEHLTGYHHQTTVMPLARTIADMRNGSFACWAGLIKTEERANFVTFSDVIAVNLPVSVIIRAEQLPLFTPYLNDDGALSLQRLLQNTALNTAIRGSRSYGPTIDDMLKHTNLMRNVRQTANDDMFLELLALGRLDWVLYYPAEMYHYRASADTHTYLISIPIIEAPDPLNIHVGCTKNPVGMVVINDINTLIAARPDKPWMKQFLALHTIAEQQRIFAAMEHHPEDFTE
ncbi:MAG: transporter substrate-binding domain-containing protein [Pseudomonadota bacterium]